MTRWPVDQLTFSKKNPSRANGRSTYIHPPSLAKIRQRTSEEIGNKQTDRQTLLELQYDVAICGCVNLLIYGQIMQVRQPLSYLPVDIYDIPRVLELADVIITQQRIFFIRVKQGKVLHDDSCNTNANLLKYWLRSFNNWCYAQDEHISYFPAFLFPW